MTKDEVIQKLAHGELVGKRPSILGVEFDCWFERFGKNNIAEKCIDWACNENRPLSGKIWIPLIKNSAVMELIFLKLQCHLKHNSHIIFRQ